MVRTSFENWFKVFNLKMGWYSKSTHSINSKQQSVDFSFSKIPCQLTDYSKQRNSFQSSAISSKNSCEGINIVKTQANFILKMLTILFEENLGSL